MQKKYKVCVIGLGYVGLTLGLHLSKKKIKVYGYDSNKEIINNLSLGKTHIFENNLEHILKKSLKNNYFQLSEKVRDDCNVYIVTVGTPLIYNKKQKKFISNLDSVKDITQKLTNVIPKKSLIIFRSTLPVGTCRNIVVQIFKKKKLSVERDYFLSFAPERTVEGNAIQELQKLPQIISGFGKKSLILSSNFFSKISNKIVRVKSLEAAEMVKLLNNSFRDLSFAFSNQVSMICNEYNLNTNEIINNANNNYPRNQIPLASPGVGGPCLTKDPYILDESISKNKDSKSIFTISRDINNKIVFNLINRINNLLGTKKRRKILLCGLSFKGYPETKDYRGSITLVFFQLLKKNSNFKVFIHDPLFAPEEIQKLLGINSENFNNNENEYDCIIIMNNNKFYKNTDPQIYSKLLKKDGIIFDYWSSLKNKFNKIKKLNRRSKYFEL